MVQNLEDDTHGMEISSEHGGRSKYFFLDEGIQESVQIDKLRQEQLNFTRIFSKIRLERDMNKITNQLDSETKRILNDLQTKCRATKPIIFSDSLHTDRDFQKAMFQGYQEKFKVVRAKSNGNCFYESISLALFGNSEYTSHLRLMQVNHIAEEQEKLRVMASQFNRSVDQVSYYI